MDWLSVIAMNMLSEQSFAQLVESVVVAIQANHIYKPQQQNKWLTQQPEGQAAKIRHITGLESSGTGVEQTQRAQQREDMGRQEEQAGQDQIQQVCQIVGKQEAKGLAGAWGNTFQTKKTHTVWVYLHNIRGLPIAEDGEVKYTHLQQFITNNKIDIIMLPECSTNWGKLQYEQRLLECTKGWWESIQWLTAYNKLEEHSS